LKKDIIRSLDGSMPTKRFLQKSHDTSSVEYPSYAHTQVETLSKVQGTFQTFVREISSNKLQISRKVEESESKFDIPTKLLKHILKGRLRSEDFKPNQIVQTLDLNTRIHIVKLSKRVRCIFLDDN